MLLSWERSAYKTLVEKFEMKSPLGRTSHIYRRIILKEILGCEGRMWNESGS
jgi:hypothetical protein